RTHRDGAVAAGEEADLRPAHRRGRHPHVGAAREAPSPRAPVLEERHPADPLDEVVLLRVEHLGHVASPPVSAAARPRSLRRSAVSDRTSVTDPSPLTISTIRSARRGPIGPSASSWNFRATSAALIGCAGCPIGWWTSARWTRPRRVAISTTPGPM